MQTLTMSMRWPVAVMLGGVYALASYSAAAQDDATTRANKMAYELAMQCFVAEGVARGFDQHVGDKNRADELERRARVSFDTANKLGTSLGYSGTRMDEDLGLVQSAELPKFNKDIQYLRVQIARCASVGI